MAEPADQQNESAMMWLDNDDVGDDLDSPGTSQANAGLDGDDASVTGAAVQKLEDELVRTRKELAEVRKELAGKIVQLSRKDQDKSQSQSAAVHEKAAEIIATATAEKESQIAALANKVTALELSLSQREEELEEARRLSLSHKKALRELMSTAADLSAEEREAVEASHSAQAQVLEDELEHLHQDLMATRTRAQLEVRAREAEVTVLRRELEGAAKHRAAAVAEAESALTEAWEVEVARVQEASQGRINDLEGEVLRLRHAVEDVQRQAANTDLPMELVALNSKKVQVQKEFEVFKEMANQSTRTNREEISRLLEENARLMARLSSKSMESATIPPAHLTQPHGSPTHRGQQPKGSQYLHDCNSKGIKVFDSIKAESYADYIPAVLMRLERQRKGLAPLVVIGCLAALIMIIAIVRAGASTRSQHRGPLCFLAQLGISIGPGCDPTAASVQDRYRKGMAELLEVTPRVHDVVNDDTGGDTAALAQAGSINAINPKPTDGSAGVNSATTGTGATLAGAVGATAAVEAAAVSTTPSPAPEPSPAPPPSPPPAPSPAPLTEAEIARRAKAHKLKAEVDAVVAMSGAWQRRRRVLLGRNGGRAARRMQSL